MNDRQSLFDNLQVLKLLYENSAAATLVIDQKGMIIMMNSEVEIVTGFSKKELEGIKKWYEIILPEDIDILKKYLKLLQVNKQDQSGKTEVRFLHRLGKISTGYLKGHSLDEQKLVILSVTDITRQKENEKELFEAKERAEASEHLKTAFLANMSHEIRTPINAIVGFADLLKPPDLSPEKKSLYLEQVINNSQDLLLLIEKIVTISRLDAGQLKLSNRQFNLNSRLKDIHHRFVDEIENRGLSGIKLSLHLGNEDENFTVSGDPMRLNEVINNLVENALKFTDAGEIEFGYYFLEDELVEGSDSLLFYVKDSGSGIKPENRELVFNRFVKILEKEEPVYKGAGLGLSIARELVALFGGTIWVEPNLEKGSVFYFSYPLEREMDVKLIPPEPDKGDIQSYDWTNVEILIAEDFESNYLFIKELLSPTGAKFLRARDGKEAVELCAKHPSINAVIMDILMPNMDGYEATKEIRKIKPEIPVIAQTAFTFEGDIQDGLYAGCFNDYIMKPYTRKILIGVLSKYMPKSDFN